MSSVDLQMLSCRGFYPKGRGEVTYSSSPVRLLTPVLLTERGSLEEIEIHAYVAGAVPRKVRTWKDIASSNGWHRSIARTQIQKLQLHFGVV